MSGSTFIVCLRVVAAVVCAMVAYAIADAYGVPFWSYMAMVLFLSASFELTPFPRKTP